MDDLRYDLPVLLLHNLNPEWTSEEISEAEGEVATLGNALNHLGHPIEVVALEDDRLIQRLQDYDPLKHIVFNWCEEIPGIPRSEPRVAAVMERMGFVFTGSPFEVLARSYDKPQVKRLLDEANVPTPPWEVFTTPDVGRWNIFPSIVKLAHEHCSIGIASDSVVTNPVELEHRVAFILEEYKQPALVEEFINGREFLSAVWGNGKISMLPAVEMDYGELTDIHDRLFTYEAKYVSGTRLYDSINMRVPAELDSQAQAELEKVALAAYRATGCRDYGRIDVRYHNGIFYVIDVNPNPDINPLTSMTCAAEEAGYSYGKMGSRIVNLAAARHPVFRR
ncbi:MAG TPA: hypothetical protein P5294_01300 [Smithellaceae bacterium]|nr:hypothetical protein [Smithellaceae bacterium]HRS89776.1 hypothetical protein [Smithellaceae bacterium]HRV25146.1 hypothetical protein [Smithellaceae bacterium]